MYRELEIRLNPREAHEEESLKEIVARVCGVERRRIVHIDIVRSSIDARHRTVMLNLMVGVHIDQLESIPPTFTPAYRDVSSASSALIIGAGPAGLFAALRLIERGIKPIIIERGKGVEERRKDLAKLYKSGIVDENSNFGFGEGGAGAFSDGKLFTRSKKRGNIRRILEILVYHGADPHILSDSHPHVGSDRLPKVIRNIRKTIIENGGEIHFGHKAESILIKNGAICGVVTSVIPTDGSEDNHYTTKEFLSDNLILATGHSARDIYKMLDSAGVRMEQKEFAVGLRIEHPQHEIDVMQYHSPEGRGDYLPAAEYNFVSQVENRGVYTFCMCPGGVVVPAATAKEQQVVNGMSSSARNTPWANSAIVTTIGEEELKSMHFEGLFGGLQFQENLERKAWKEGGGKLYAPAQMLIDFLEGRESQKFPKTSYHPGINSSRLDLWLPKILEKRLKNGIIFMGKRAKAFISQNALLLGVETRTSSPLRIPRNPNTHQHLEIKGLYPCGEGSGYSGGIISSAIDGEICAENLNIS